MVPSSASNPFASKYVRPGAMPYLFNRGESLDDLLERYRRQSFWGEIIGPHGSGKSTLISMLTSRLRELGHAVVVRTLGGDTRGAQRGESLFRLDPETTIVAVDGVEQLSRISRWRLRQFCRRRGIGLLVSAHSSQGLPGLYETSTDARRISELVRKLAPSWPQFADASVVTRLLCEHGGNAREVFFDLYDRIEIEEEK